MFVENIMTSEHLFECFNQSAFEVSRIFSMVKYLKRISHICYACCM